MSTEATKADRLAEISILAGVLRELVDAVAPITKITYPLVSIHDTSWEQFDEARRAALRVLTKEPRDG